MNVAAVRRDGVSHKGGGQRTDGGGGWPSFRGAPLLWREPENPSGRGASRAMDSGCAFACAQAPRNDSGRLLSSVCPRLFLRVSELTRAPRKAYIAPNGAPSALRRDDAP